MADTLVAGRVTASPRTRTAPLAPPATLLCCALAYAAFSQGAFYRAPFATTAALLVVAAALALRQHGVAAAGRAVPLAAAGVAAWSLTSAALGGDVTRGKGPALVAIAVAAAYVTVRLSGAAERDRIARAVVAVGCCVAIFGWLGVVLRVVPLSLVDQGLWRAASTVTYSNGTAGLLAPVALLALARVTERRADPLATAAAALLLTGVAATLSRAGYLALALGVAALTAHRGPRRAASTWPAFAGAAVAFGGLLPTMPANAPARPLLAAAALAAGLAIATAARRLPARQVLAGAAAAVVVALAFGVGTPVADAARQVAGVRVTTASPDRAGEWATTWEAATTSPVTGVGPGNLDLTWTGADGRLLRANFTHNEYLQLFAEQGTVGLALALALLGALAARTWRRTAYGAAAAAGLTALLVHGAFDFVWHIPLVPVVGAVVLALAAPTREETS